MEKSGNLAYTSKTNFYGNIAVGDIVAALSFTNPVSFPANFIESIAYCEIPPEASAEFSILLNGNPIGNIYFFENQKVGSFSSIENTIVNVGDVISLVVSTADDAIQNLSFSLNGLIYIAPISFTLLPNPCVSNVNINVGGNVYPENTALQLGLSQSNDILPSEWVDATVDGQNWIGQLSSGTIPGLNFVWARYLSDPTVYKIGQTFSKVPVPARVFVARFGQQFTVAEYFPVTEPIVGIEQGFLITPTSVAIDNISVGWSTTPDLSGFLYYADFVIPNATTNADIVAFITPSNPGNFYCVAWQTSNSSVFAASQQITVTTTDANDQAIVTIQSQSNPSVFGLVGVMETIAGINQPVFSDSDNSTGEISYNGSYGFIIVPSIDTNEYTINGYWTNYIPVTEPTIDGSTTFSPNSTSSGSTSLTKNTNYDYDAYANGVLIAPPTAGTWYLSYWIDYGNNNIDWCILTPFNVLSLMFETNQTNLSTDGYSVVFYPEIITSIQAAEIEIYGQYDGGFGSNSGDGSTATNVAPNPTLGWYGATNAAVYCDGVNSYTSGFTTSGFYNSGTQYYWVRYKNYPRIAQSYPLHVSQVGNLSHCGNEASFVNSTYPTNYYFIVNYVSIPFNQMSLSFGSWSIALTTFQNSTTITSRLDQSTQNVPISFLSDTTAKAYFTPVGDDPLNPLSSEPSSGGTPLFIVPDSVYENSTIPIFSAFPATSGSGNCPSDLVVGNYYYFSVWYSTPSNPSLNFGIIFDGQILITA